MPDHFIFFTASSRLWLGESTIEISRALRRKYEYSTCARNGEIQQVLYFLLC